MGEEKAKEKEKGVGPAPADLHPPLNKKSGLEGIGKRVGSWGKKKRKRKRKREKERKRKCSYKSKCMKESPVTFKSQTDPHIHSLA